MLMPWDADASTQNCFFQNELFAEAQVDQPKHKRFLTYYTWNSKGS